MIDPTCSSAIFVFPSQIFNVLSMRRKIVERIKSECFDELIPGNGMRAIPFISGDKLFVLSRISKIDRNSFRYKKVIFYKSIQFFCLLCRAIVLCTYKNMKFHETSNPVYVLTFLMQFEFPRMFILDTMTIFLTYPVPQVYQCPNNLNYFYLL